MTENDPGDAGGGPSGAETRKLHVEGGSGHEHSSGDAAGAGQPSTDDQRGVDEQRAVTGQWAGNGQWPSEGYAQHQGGWQNGWQGQQWPQQGAHQQQWQSGQGGHGGQNWPSGQNAQNWHPGRDEQNWQGAQSWQGYGGPPSQPFPQQGGPYSQNGPQGQHVQGQPPQGQTPTYWSPPGGAGYGTDYGDGYGPATPGGPSMAATVSRQGSEMVARARTAVAGMSWQMRVFRGCGVVSILAGVLGVLSLFFAWWTLSIDDGVKVRASVAPFRGIYFGGSKFAEAAARKGLDQEFSDVVSTLMTTIGIIVLVGSVALIVGGYLVAKGSRMEVGGAIALVGALVVAYGRVPSRIVAGVADTVGDGGDEFFGEIGQSVPRAGFGEFLVGSSVWLGILAGIVFIGMCVYREIVRIRRVL